MRLLSKLTLNQKPGALPCHAAEPHPRG